MNQSIVAALEDPALYPHPVTEFQVIETHISWVLLTGPYVYKIKKPVDFGFLDFTTLAARKHFVEEELRLNQRLTKNLYLDIVPITGSVDHPELGGNGEVIEYALKMKQFPQSALLTAVQKRGELTDVHIDQLARQIAEFHLNTPVVPQSNPLGTAESIMAPVRQNFEQIRPFLQDANDLAQLAALEDWAETSFIRLRPVFDARKTHGFIRECHGDIHLGNAALIDDEVILFDCIEFNEQFRFIDVCSDFGFLVMDLEDHGLKSLARRFVSQYLEYTGDYASLEILDFYKAYRALVRAKVCLLSLDQQADPVQKAATFRRYRNYANLAESYSAIPFRFLAITHGVSASGKSHVAQRLVSALGAIRVRSDVERKRLFANETTQAAGLDEGIYHPDRSEETYCHLHRLAQTILQAGYPAVLDATYLKHDQRLAAAQVAETNGVVFLILDCCAPDNIIQQWLAKRHEQGGDPSDATMEIIKAQKLAQEPLDSLELSRTLLIDTHEAASLDTFVERLRTYLPSL